MAHDMHLSKDKRTGPGTFSIFMIRKLHTSKYGAGVVLHHRRRALRSFSRTSPSCVHLVRVLGDSAQTGTSILREHA